jgi:hypothetical protein
MPDIEDGWFMEYKDKVDEYVADLDIKLERVLNN